MSWANLGFTTHRLALNTSQQRWFTAFAALQRASRDVTIAGEADWLTLDDFHSPALWAMLAEAPDLGITLVSSKSGTLVVIGQHADISVDLSREQVASGSDLYVRASLTIDGRTHDIERANPLSEHGVYAYSWQSSAVITLAPCAGLTGLRLRLLKRPSVVVPAREAPEFFSSHYPRLHRTTVISSADASVELPPVAPGVLVLSATFFAETSTAHALVLGVQRTTNASRPNGRHRPSP